MSLFGAMFSGVSGLNAQSQFLGMISDNISNVNTVGYKGAVSRFSTLVTAGATKTTFSPGGVQSNTTQLVDRQGLIQASQSKTDISISGSGFFTVNESSNPGVGDQFLYTRAGSFTPDQNGNLRNTSGHFLMGWPTDATGVPTPANLTALSSLEAVDVSGIAGNAVETSTISLGANLPASAASGTAHVVTTQIFDSLGIEHNLAFTFTKQAATNTWQLSIGDPTRADTGAVSGTTTFAALDVVFNGDGSLAGYDTDMNGTVDTGTLPTIGVSAWTTGANNSTLTPNLGSQNQVDGMSQFANDFTTYFIEQDGVRFGVFSGVSIDENGLVTALFDNGETTPIYQVPVATFANPNGLNALSGNVFQESDTSGTVLLNQAATGSAGKISPSSLEASNIDLAAEFSNMIVTQRAYTASARIINIADEMLEEVTLLAR